MTGATAEPLAEATPRVIQDLLDAVHVEIDGVPYVACDIRTIAWDRQIYLDLIFMDAGLDEPARLMSRDAPLAQNVKHLLRALIRSGRMFDFVAGAIVPEGQQWDEARARVVALRLAKLEDVEVRTKLQNLIAVFLAGFFLNGRNAFGISPSASTATMAPSAPGQTAAAVRSADGAPSSADSLATIQTG